MSYFGNILKSALLLAVVGVALAYAAPMLASVATSLGVAPALASQLALTHPIWGGVFFGAFGAINAAVAPFIEKIFGHHSPESAQNTAERDSAPCEKTRGHAHAPSGPSADMATEREEASPASDKFQKLVGGARASDASFLSRTEASRAETTQLSA